MIYLEVSLFSICDGVYVCILILYTHFGTEVSGSILFITNDSVYDIECVQLLKEISCCCQNVALLIKLIANDDHAFGYLSYEVNMNHKCLRV